MPRHLLIGVLIGLLAGTGGCARPGLVVRSDRGEPAVMDLQRVCPIEYAKDDLQTAMELFAEHVAAVIHRQEGKLRVRLASSDPMVAAYLSWCGRRGAPGDCLDLLEEAAPGLSGSAKRSIALRMALAFALEEVVETVRTVDPVKVEAMILIWFTIYFASLVFPDATVTKALNVVMSAHMVAFLGWDGFRSFVLGYRDMAKAADAARTFDQLFDAGRAYGQRMGPSMVRIVIALVTWGLSGATGMARPVTSLPGGAQAVANANAQGFNLMAVSGGSVAVSASGTVTLVLAESAVGPQGASKQVVPDERSPTPDTHPERFDPTRGRKGKIDRETGEIWEKDLFHKNHYEVYRNRKDYDNGRRERAVWDDGRLKETFRR